jgi:hypothetical protein
MSTIWLILPLSPNDDQQIAEISFSNGKQNILKCVVYTHSQPISFEKKKEVLSHDFYDLLARYMDLYYGHRSYTYDFIKADFHRCKNGQIVHLFFYSLVFLAIYMLKDGSKFHFLIQLLEWLYWIYHIT